MDSSARPTRRTGNLHRGRLSAAGAEYFVTMVTKGRKPWLAAPGQCAAVLATLQSWQAENHGRILAATVMPDHVHVLFELGDRLTVGQTVARWKAEIRRAIKYTENFQRDFWEHQLRDEEGSEDYGLYIFLNPYRAGLLKADEPWHGWWMPEPGLFRFPEALNKNGAPPHEWINWPDERFEGLAHGE